ncbi:MAG: hypothetical protein CMQ91_03760 [Gammaproteobacteria bacterium]|jgi:cell division septal protein FtsQ|nr:hypothetical protein [Gammaproteobacteria bacterium]
MEINKIIISIFLVLSFSVHSEDNEIKSRNCHFVWNEIFCLSQNGKSFDKEDYKNSDLVKLSGQEQSELELIDSFYLIQQEILFHKLIIKSIDQTRSGNIKVFLKGGQEIRFQQHKLEDQLSRLNLFLISSESKKLINNFKSIDLRYKTKIAINYF